MEFEFDPRKSASNRNKHGIDFNLAQELWHDDRRIEVEARSTDELRLLMIARLNGTFWSAIFTYRSDRIRIISVRRSRPEEEDLYES